MKNISQQFESELSKAMSIIVSASYNATAQRQLHFNMTTITN
jgi:hypothetical protein